uniref:Extended synaptotagmin-like protein 3 n=1 Tax=Oreochromis niloticus TaxID=8128 RepID=A0A669BD78_ORENI
TVSAFSEPGPQTVSDPMAQKTAESIQCTDRLGSSTVNHVIIEFVMYCGRAVFICYPVYLLGYLGINISWVLLCVFMLTYWKKNRQWKVARITSAIELVDNEKRAIKTELRSALPMASWVQFSDVEKVHWLNKVLKQAWPFFGTYMEKLLRENIQQSIRFSSPSLKTFTFTKIHFGRIPLKITGIRAYTHEVEHREVILDMNISYDGDVDIRADVNSAMTAGVKGVKLHGMMRVILEPLIGQTPLVGGVTFFFIRRPTLKINWTGMTNLLSSPAFSSLSDETIMNIIASFIVLPNRMCIPLIDQVKMEQMRFPLPRGVVRVHLLEARDLLAMDTYVMGLVKGKSDPYATLRVGNIHFKSKTVKKNLHPRWNEVYEFVVHEAPGQELEVGLYDEDVDKDDFLGSLSNILLLLQWFPLEDVPHGEVHLKLQWFSLQTDTSLLQEVNVICVFLNIFFVHVVQVKEPEKKNPLGVLNLLLSRLLNTSDLTLDEYFLLEHSGANSQIKLKATLRVGKHTHTHLSSCTKEMFSVGFLIVLFTSVISSIAHVFYLTQILKLEDAIRNHRGSFGEIELNVRYVTLKHKLIVFIIRCRNLFPCSENGTDSYVRLYLLPDQTWKHRKKTHVKKRMINPVFNEKFEFDVLLQEAQNRKLDVSVKNNSILVSLERKDIGSVC